MQLDDTFNFDLSILSYYSHFGGDFYLQRYLPKESKAEQINVQGCILQFGVN